MKMGGEITAFHCHAWCWYFARHSHELWPHSVLLPWCNLNVEGCNIWLATFNAFVACIYTDISLMRFLPHWRAGRVLKRMDSFHCKSVYGSSNILLALVFWEQLIVLSNMSEEGGEVSFSIDMFDLSKLDQPDPGQHSSLPVHQLQEIGAGDLLPSAGSYFVAWAQFLLHLKTCVNWKDMYFSLWSIPNWVLLKSPLFFILATLYHSFLCTRQIFCACFEWCQCTIYYLSLWVFRRDVALSSLKDWFGSWIRREADHR